MSTLKVDTILKRSGTGTITLGQSGDTLSIPSGATIANSGTATGFGGTNDNLFNAYRSSSFTINHDTWTNVNPNAEVFDLDSKFDTSNGRYTPASTGYYKFNASVSIEFDNTYLGRRVGLRLLKNGNTIAENFQKFGDSGFDKMKQHSVPLSYVDYSSSASDYYMIYALANEANGSNQNTIVSGSSNTFFEGYKLIT